MTAMDPDTRLFDVAAVPHLLTLAERFMLPPFTVLDARSGWWQDRKRLWKALGLQSELGRDARTFVAAGERADAFAAALQAKAGTGARTADVVAEGVAAGLDETSAKMLALQNGQSIFDPVLCELAYRWFCPPGGLILDPFAGGSVRGIVAGYLGYRYHGVDLAARQIEENRRQAEIILGEGQAAVKWAAGDSAAVLPRMRYPADKRPDLVFSCPPYHDLEVYSDDPADISNMPWAEFVPAYRAIISAAVDHLADDRFAVWVVGEIRRTDKGGAYRGFVPETIDAFEAAGARYYNELVLVQPAGTLPIRAARQFSISRKLGRTHQTALVFVKGDPKKAAEACGDVMTAPVSEDLEADS